MSSNGPQQFLHYGNRQYTPEAYIKARERGELGATVHADGSKTLLSGETVSPIVAKRAEKATADTEAYNETFQQDFRDPEMIEDSPVVGDATIDPVDTGEVTPFTLEELQAQAKEKKIKSRHLLSYDNLLAALYPQQ